MQITPDTIAWNKTPPVAKLPDKSLAFRLEKTSDDRINGSIPVWGNLETPEEKIAARIGAASRPPETSKLASSFTKDPATEAKEDSFGFLDVLDMINPLQHIPLLSNVYRNITGDTINPVSRIIGGAAFGGPLGAAAGAVNALFQVETGKDVGENIVASIHGMQGSNGDTTLAVANLGAGVGRYNS